MDYYLSKLLPMFVMPVSMVFFGMIIGFWLYSRGKKRAGKLTMIGSLLLLWISANPRVAAWAVHSLEKQYPPVPVERVARADCLVTLGGSLGLGLAPRVTTELTDAVDRIYQAANLYRAGKAGRIIVAAGGVEPPVGVESEALATKRLLIEWGVPETAITLETRSRTTRQNAVNAEPLITEAGCETTLLMTSAWHMPRALATFRKVGVDAVPVSVDVRFVRAVGGQVGVLLPQADALATTSMVIREWMGYWVYRWRGWL